MQLITTSGPDGIEQPRKFILIFDILDYDQAIRMLGRKEPERGLAADCSIDASTRSRRQTAKHRVAKQTRCTKHQDLHRTIRQKR